MNIVITNIICYLDKELIKQDYIHSVTDAWINIVSNVLITDITNNWTSNFKFQNLIAPDVLFTLLINSINKPFSIY